MKVIDKILYMIVAPFIFGAGFVVGRIERTIEFWKENVK